MKPRKYTQFFGNVYNSEPTSEMCNIMLWEMYVFHRNCMQFRDDTRNYIKTLCEQNMFVN